MDREQIVCISVRLVFDSAMTIEIGLLSESLATEIATKWSFASEIIINLKCKTKTDFTILKIGSIYYTIAHTVLPLLIGYRWGVQVGCQICKCPKLCQVNSIRKTYLWTFLICLRRFDEIENPRWHKSQTYGCSPVWVLRCRTRFAFRGNCFLQYGHTNRLFSSPSHSSTENGVKLGWNWGEIEVRLRWNGVKLKWNWVKSEWTRAEKGQIDAFI